jgi:hypothetical protein
LPRFSARPIVRLTRVVRLLAVSALVNGSISEGQTRVLREGFDGAATSWQLDAARPSMSPQVHRRNGQITHDGGASEEFRFLTSQAETPCKLVQSVPFGLVFDELTASLWVQSNRAGLRIGLRMRFPHQLDPRTRKPLTVDLLGETYSDPHRWQQLNCRTTDRAVEDQLVRLRNQFMRLTGRPDLDARECYVDAVILYLELQPGDTAFYVDDLAVGPLVEPPPGVAADRGSEADGATDRPRLVIRDDQMLLDGRPLFPLIAAYHGEQVDLLAASGFNVIWIERYDDEPLLDALTDAGLFAMAEPPAPTSQPAGFEETGASGLLPITSRTRQILFWNLGTHEGPARLAHTATWAELVREADLRLQRPLLLDVSAAEGEFHRHVDVLSSSRHILHTSTSPHEYFDGLRAKRKLALPGKPCLTHIQTEPASASLALRAEGNITPVVEPEQVWMQAYAALSAGYKGISYWRFEPLQNDTPGGDECRLAITLCNEHLRLLEPWLATGKTVETVPATVVGANPVPPGAKPRPGGRAGLARRRGDGDPSPARAPVESDIQVAVIKGKQSLLLVPVWYEDDAQFQPGPMTAREISFLISPQGENVRAWEVTTTSISPLPQPQVRRVTGGLEIHVTDFDQFTAILLTPDQESVVSVARQVEAIREQAARGWIDLAATKLARVSSVHAELEADAPPVRNGTRLLAEARRSIDTAETALARGSPDEARRLSRQALSLMRTVQRRHWENASSRLSSGVSSPHTICFQTLPDHWRMVAALGGLRAPGDNLLKSGRFEDSDTILASGWEHAQSADQAIRAYSQLFGIAAEGRYCLQLVAEPADPSRPPTELRQPAVRWISPALPVYAGQVVLITGKVQLPAPVTATPDGLMIYESLTGTVGALRWKDPTPDRQWESFQVIREVLHSGELHVTLELRGLGDVRIDDLRVLAVDPDR